MALRINRRFEHLDASENLFLGRQLEIVKAKTYDIKLPGLHAREYIPVNNEIDRGARVLVYRQYSQVGMAKLIASYADDLPRADVKAAEFKVSIKEVGDAYGYNVQEIRSASRAGVDLETKKAGAARRAIEILIDRIATTGDSFTGLLGLLNQPNAQTYTVPNGAAASPLWANKTAAEILADLNGIANLIVNNTKEIEIPDTLLLPPTSYQLLATKQFSAASDKTVLDFWRDTSLYIKNIKPWLALETAGSGGTRRMVAYRRDPDVLELLEQPFEQFPPQERNLEFVVNCMARTGGVIVYYPMAIAYGDGI